MKKSEFDIIFHFAGKEYRAYAGGILWGLMIFAQVCSIAAFVYIFTVVAILLG